MAAQFDKNKNNYNYFRHCDLNCYIYLFNVPFCIPTYVSVLTPNYWTNVLIKRIFANIFNLKVFKNYIIDKLFITFPTMYVLPVISLHLLQLNDCTGPYWELG